MGNFQFNSKGVTRIIRQLNSSVAWQSNTQTPVQILQTGYLKDLIVTVQGTPTLTGTAASVFVDPMGPFNVIQNFQVNTNLQAGVLNLSGLGAAWYSMVKYGLENMGNNPYAPLLAQANSASGMPSSTSAYPVLDFTYQSDGAITAVPTAGAANPLWQVPYLLPLAQQINTLGGLMGIWNLQDPSIQMTLLFTPNSSSSASPFLITGSTVGTSPYNAVAPATNNWSLTTPVTRVQRVMFDPPLSAANDPDFGFVSTLYEEQWNTALGGASTINWKALANSGWILRLVFSVTDSNNLPGAPAAYTAAYNTRGGVAPSNMTNANAINFTIGNNAPVVVESIYDYTYRANDQLGSQLPQGVFFLDFLGKDLTLQNVMDTFTDGNINLQMNFNSALGSTSSGKVIRQMLMAVQQ